MESDTEDKLFTCSCGAQYVAEEELDECPHEINEYLQDDVSA